MPGCRILEDILVYDIIQAYSHAQYTMHIRMRNTPCIFTRAIHHAALHPRTSRHPASPPHTATRPLLTQQHVPLQTLGRWNVVHIQNCLDTLLYEIIHVHSHILYITQQRTRSPHGTRHPLLLTQQNVPSRTRGRP